MKKEILLAIIIGLAFGLVITYGLYRVRKATQSAKTQPISTTAPTTPTEEPAVAAQLTILHPEDNTVQEESSTTVTGTALPDTIIVLFANDMEYITTSDASGNFSFTVDLDEGSTILTVHAVNEDGETVTAQRAIVVSSLLFESTDSASPAAEEE
ncbi:MAG: hypothetical protein GW946_02390 [Candidatus Pacebacteria bacterium]|nr:hypothetical protein [Candidatus Paceibacterota bacterium]PIR60022.1 MAG: hypothetical protein COU67_03730 [Candidatus Pacebacteria bacterium CG10_big_fil_rev_8_21_14_0_10_44_54]